MTDSYSTARAIAGILVLLIVAVAGRQALAEENSWVLHKGTLPGPAAASEALRDSIAEAGSYGGCGHDTRHRYRNATTLWCCWRGIAGSAGAVTLSIANNNCQLE